MHEYLGVDQVVTEDGSESVPGWLSTYVMGNFRRSTRADSNAPRTIAGS